MGAIRAYRWAMAAFGILIAAHVLALFSSPLITPALDLSTEWADRADAITAHPLLWRIGWIPWQVAALSNVLFTLALVHHLVRRGTDIKILGWAIAAAVLAPCAAALDLTGEMIYTGTLVDMAEAGNRTSFLEAEAGAAESCATRANLLYVSLWFCVLMAVCELRGGWRNHPTLFGWGTVALGLFAVFSGLNTHALASMLEDGNAPVAESMSTVGGVAFLLFVPWLCALAAQLGRDHHERYPAPDRFMHRFSWPKPGLGEHLAVPLQEPGLRDVLRPLIVKFSRLRSDVTDCVYVSWLVPAERVEGLLPEGMDLDVERSGQAIVSVLAYRHGHFGPERFRALRLRLPSPRQVNVRLYLATEEKGQPRESIWFLRTALDSKLYTFAARLLSDGLPAHLPAEVEHRRDGEGWWTHLESGHSGAPQMRLRVHERNLPKIPKAWQSIHRDWEDLIWHVVSVTRGVRPAPALGGHVETDIRIAFQIDDVIPAEVEEFSSDLLDPIVRDCPCLAFVVPKLTFRVLGERLAQ